jgi:hypothetical protein
MHSLPLPQTWDGEQGDSILIKQDHSYLPNWAVQEVLDWQLSDNIALLHLFIYSVLSYNSSGNSAWLYPSIITSSNLLKSTIIVKESIPLLIQ